MIEQPTGVLSGPRPPRPRRRPRTEPVLQFRYTPADPVVGLLLILGLGIAALAGFVATGEVLGLLVGIPLVLVVVVVCTRWILRARNLPRLPAPQVRRIRGERWTVVPPEPSERLVRLATIGLLVAPFLGGAALSVEENPGIAVLLLLVPLSVVRVTVRTARGDTVAAVALRPDRVLYQRDGFRAVVRWDDITTVYPSTSPESVVLRTSTDGVTYSGVRSRLARAVRSTRGLVHVSTEDLALDGPALSSVLSHYAGSPGERADLGTPLSLAVIDRVAAGARTAPTSPVHEPLLRFLPTRVPAPPVRRRPGEPGGAVGLGLALLAIAAGLCLVVSTWTGPDDNTWFGGLFMAAGLGAVVARLLRRGSRPAPPPTLTTTRRGATTVVRRDSRRFSAGFAPYVACAALCAAWVLLTWPSDAALGSLVTLAALVAGGPVGVLALGLLTPGRLDLDETGLLYRSRGQRSRIRWDQIDQVWCGSTDVDLSARSGTWFRHINTPGLWSGEIATSPRHARVATDGMCLDGPGMARLLHEYARSAERRRELGTEASLLHIARIVGDRSLHATATAGATPR
ncbi:hypothetical protein [Sanguibacter sp. 25GB23B1]|uniref:hypothetical protein n=1 Tax=unclassified Sanguibacter TaxID=2645534 RepID=UPI0032AFFA8B